MSSPYAWEKATSPQQRVDEDDQSTNVSCLHADINRMTEEHYILRKAAAYFAYQCGRITPLSYCYSSIKRFEIFA